MKRTLIFLTLIALSIGAFGQTRARTGLSVGDHKVAGTNIVVQDSVTRDGDDIVFYNDGDTLNPYVPVASQVEGVALADSVGLTGSVADTYVSGDDFKTYSGDDMYEAIAALGGNIKAQSLLCPIFAATGAATDLSDGNAYFCAVYISKAQTITGVKFGSAETANFTEDNWNGAALYTYSAGVITKVATTADDHTMWEVGNGSTITKAFETPYAATVGIYYIGFLYNASAEVTIPELWSVSVSAQGGFMQTGAASAERLFCYVAAQATLPATVTLADATASTTVRWCALY